MSCVGHADAGRLLSHFWAKHAREVLSDAAIVEYLHDTLCGEAAAELQASDLDEMLCGFSPNGWQSLGTPVARQRKLWELVRQVSACSKAQFPALPPAVTQCEPALRPQNVVADKLQRSEPHRGSSEAGSSSPEAAAFPAGLFPAEKPAQAQTLATQQQQQQPLPPPLLPASPQDPVSAAISTFLQRHGGAELQDEAVAEYFSATITDRSDAGAEAAADDLAALDDMLCGFSPDGWGRDSEAQRQMRLCDLLSDISKLQLDRSRSSKQQQPLPHKQPAAELPSAVQPQHQQQCQSDLHAGNSADSQPEADPAALSTLRELCPDGTSADFISHVLLETCHGNLESAARWLVEREDLQRRESAWRQACAQAAADEAKEKQRLKAHLQRFDLEAVGTSGGDSSKRGGRRNRAGHDALPPYDSSGSKEKVACD